MRTKSSQDPNKTKVIQNFLCLVQEHLQKDKGAKKCKESILSFVSKLINLALMIHWALTFCQLLTSQWRGENLIKKKEMTHA